MEGVFKVAISLQDAAIYIASHRSIYVFTVIIENWYERTYIRPKETVQDRDIIAMED